MIRLEWTEFKTLSIQNKLSITFVETSNMYLLFIPVNSMIFNSKLVKDGGVDVLEFEASYKSLGNKTNGSNRSPFAVRSINGKSLYKRVHGISANVVNGVMSELDFVVPYDNVKINGVEVTGASAGDTVDFEIYDTPSGFYSDHANAKLMQFGYSVNVAKDFYAHHSEYDSDLVKDIKLKIKYYPAADGLIGINFILNELK